MPKSFDTEIHGVVVDGNKFMALGSKDHVSSKNKLEQKEEEYLLFLLIKIMTIANTPQVFLSFQKILEELAILLKSGINVYIRS